MSIDILVQDVIIVSQGQARHNTTDTAPQARPYPPGNWGAGSENSGNSYFNIQQTKTITTKGEHDMSFNEAWEELGKSVSSVKYFNRKTFEIIVRDMKTAKDIFKSGGDVQEFYRNSETSRTKFYRENGGAYCQLLSILA